MSRVSTKSGALSVSRIARSIRFQQHPTMTACWIWTGPFDHGNKAIACVDGEKTTARRAVYLRYRDELPDGNLKPQCREALCVNPSHMREVKQK